jgi:hypothetical protein
MQDNGSSLGDAEFLLAGHKAENNSLVPLGSDSRWGRVWYLDKSDGASINATLSFDFSDAGLLTPAPTDLIQLLYSPTDPLSFSTLSLTASVIGDTFSFNLADNLLLDGYYTIGIQAIPEPGTAGILSVGSLAMLLGRRRNRPSVGLS